MSEQGRGYAAYFNRRYDMWGALWEHPYRSCLVESADYVLACHRYIERNPVRAKMVAAPQAHPWSSYAGNVGLRIDELLTPHPEYLALGLESTTRLSSYAQLVAGVDDPQFLEKMREATDCGFPLVGDRVRAQLEKEGVRLERGKTGPQPQSGTEAFEQAGQLSLLTE